MRKKIEVMCLACKKSFLKREYDVKRSLNNFCSRKCSAAINSAKKQKYKNLVCMRCETTFQTTMRHQSKNLCITCKRINNSKSRLKFRTIKDFTSRPHLVGKHPSWHHAQIRSLNRDWNSDLKSSGCQVCGYNKHVELAHIKPLSKFDENTTLEIVNAPDNILVLCPNCHWEFDHGSLTISDIPLRKLA